MKSKYVFEILDMEDGITAVPVGENADELHAVLRLNQTSKCILEMLKEEISEEDICIALEEKYNTENVDIKRLVHEFINKLIEAGIVN